VMFINKHFIGQLLAAALIALSFSGYAEEIRDYYAEPGLNPFKETTQDLTESIDVFSGTLQHKYVDLMVPGNGGLDITLSRIYTSQQDSHVGNYRSYTGMGWTMHMGRIVVPTDHKDKICSQPLWSISTRDNPSLEFSDGGRELLVLKDANVDETLISKTNWKADCQSVTQGMRVTSPSGTIYYMDVAEFTADQYSWYTSRIEDTDGNWIDIAYGTAGGGIRYIDAITASDGRTVTFEYKDIATNAVRLWKVTANGQTVEYSYTPVVGGPVGSQHLTQVTRPDGLKWNYTYFPDLGLLAGGSHSLQSVTYPHGGQIAYGYQLVRFDPTSPFETTSIYTKNTSGPGIAPGNWTYYFTPSTGVGAYDYTQVETPNGTEVYAHQGYVTGGSLVWPTGLLVQKVIYDSIGNPVEAITNTWSSRIISVENYWHGRDKLDNETAAPVLANRNHWLDGSAVNTVYSNHDAYGNPGQIDEECNLVGCSDRITVRTYLNDTANWFIGLPLVDTIIGVGSTSRTYYGNGRLKSLDTYGVTTTYEYTPEGDLAKETDARGFSRTYSNYVRGIAEQDSSEVSATKSIVTSRVVNPTGTVATVTDGRGVSKSFTYDGLNRLTSIDYPVNDDVTISYAQGNKTLTRGNYEEQSVLNGFGRTIRQDRKDLFSGEVISTATSYDALGRTVFQSYPNSVLGVTTELDVVNRPTRITKGDGTFKQIEYGSFLDQTGTMYLGEERHTDERLNVSYRLSQYYGSFDNNVGLINLITDETFTSVERSALGEVIQTVQGMTDTGGIANAVTRSYVYDSRRFLESATNPETGTTIFGRDAIGNKISSQVGASAITAFVYDGINRLTDIDYPGGTLDVSLTYDDNSNLVQSVKGDISWIYQYDDNDNLTHEQLTIGGTDSRTYDISYLYSGLDAVSQITYPNAIVVGYAPDAFGRPTQAGSYALSASYHPNGVLNSVQYGNGVSITNSLNSIQQLDGILAVSPTEDLVDLMYTYDPVGNVTDIVDHIQPADSITLNYDVNDRMTGAGGRWGTGSFSYSSHGDILSKEVGSTRLAYGYGTSRRLLQLDNLTVPAWTNRTTFQYDAYGNLSDKSIRISDVNGIILLKDFTYLFDDASNLLEVDDLDTAEIERKYQYDANNYRTIEEEAGNKRFSVYNQAGILAFESDDLTCEDSAYVYLGSTLIAKDVRSQVGCSGGDTTPPVVTPPPDLTIEATAVLTAVTLGDASADDDVDGLLTPTADNSGPFGLGVHTITWSATDAAGNLGTATQVVTVEDTTPPDLLGPSDITVTSAVPLAVDLGTATATDIFNPVVVSNDAPALFPLGVTNVTWQAVDANGNSATVVQVITVDDVIDTVPPVVTPPPNLVVEANAYLSTVDLGAGSANDNVDGPLTPVPDALGPFGLGRHTIIWSATDAAGNVGTAIQTLTVEDTTPPALTVPADITVDSADPIAVALGSATANDFFEPVVVTNDAPALFPLGVTNVTWQAVDFNGNTATGVQTVTVNALSPLSLDVSRDLSSPQIEGAIYNLAAVANGGSGSYEYRFEVKGPATGDIYQMVQDYGAVAALAWNTTGYVGENTIRVSVRNAGSTDAPVRRWVKAYVNPVNAADGLSVIRVQPSPQEVGAVYQFTATGSGGSGSYEYQFEVKGPATGDSYQLVQAYSPVADLSWDTTGYIGDNVFRISVRNAGTTDSPVRRWVKAYVNPVAAADDLTVTRTPSSPQVEGAIYQITATASGGSGVYEYKFEVKFVTAGGDYQMLQDYSAANVLNWNTSGHVGENTVRISARNAGSDHAPVRKWRKADVTSP